MATPPRRDHRLVDVGPARPSSENTSGSSSATHSRPGSVGWDKRSRKPRGRVQFTVGGQDDDGDDRVVSPTVAMEPQKPLPSVRRLDIADTDAATDITEVSLKTPAWSGKTSAAALSAQDRASRLASRLGQSHSAPGSRRASIEDLRIVRNTDPLLSPASSPPLLPLSHHPISLHNIPLEELDHNTSRRPFSLYEDPTDEDEESPAAAPPVSDHRRDDEAEQLVRAVTHKLNLHRVRAAREPSSGATTPAEYRSPHDYSYEYVPRPTEYKGSILSAILKTLEHGPGAVLSRQSSREQLTKIKEAPSDVHAAAGRERFHRSHSETPTSSGHTSGHGTPSRKHKEPKWYQEDRLPGTTSPGGHSTSSTAGLLESATPAVAAGVPRAKSTRSHLPHNRSSGMIAAAVDKLHHPTKVFKHREDHQAISVHITDVLGIHQYLINLCRALMLYGAPTHRLEEYMTTSARYLGIKGQFLYLPGCMVISFDDPILHITEVKLVKEEHGVDLGRFKDVFMIYKNVIHDVYPAAEGSARLEAIFARKAKYGVLFRVFIYGIASAAVGPFAFSARPIDLPIIFLLGCMLGVMQLVIAPRNPNFRNVFEVAAAVATSFAARGFGTIKSKNGEYVFCFAAMAQSSIALILPGYTILCASLELQSRNIIAGSVRMVYAIIYSLFLGFGITIGTALFGLMDPNAVSDVTCAMPSYWHNPYLSHFPFVPIFTLCLIILNQAKWRQSPIMLLIAFLGYQVNFWSSKRFANNVQVANALGAFAIGSVANLYSRFAHGLAAAAMLPAIFVQVPSGLAASGSLVAGLTSANQITGNATGVSVINNGTQGFQAAQNSTNGSDMSGQSNVYSGTIFNVGYGMVQVAIGISVGLCLSALIVYPGGKRRSGLFSF